MPVYTANANEAFLPEAAAALVVQPVQAASVAAQVANVVTTSAHRFHVPIVSADPSAGWVAEGDEIAAADATLGEEVVNFAKLAGLTVISRELADDSSPAAAKVVGDGLARDIAKKLDAAFFGNVAAPAPSGLDALAGVTAVDGGTAYSDLDPFLEAQSEAEQVGATIGAFVTDPTTALTLAQLRDETGSNRTLLQPDPTQPSRRLIAGIPLWVSPAVTVGTVWGLPAARTFVVMRDDTTLEVDRSVYFTSDRLAVKATMRVGFGFPHAAAVTKVTLTP